MPLDYQEENLPLEDSEAAVANFGVICAVILYDAIPCVR